MHYAPIDVDTDQRPPSYTPWGSPERRETLAPGIVSFDTDRHGGFWLSDSRLSEMPDSLREIVPFTGRGWYEEDEDWAIVALAFPSLFSEKSCKAAIKTAKIAASPKAFDWLPESERKPSWPGFDLGQYLTEAPQGRQCAFRAGINPRNP